MNSFNLNDEQQQQVTMLTNEAIDYLTNQLAFNLNPVDVLFDLTGRAAGMYVHKHNKQYIRYNPYIFAKYFTENISVTIPHEVAHYAVDKLYGKQNIKPHGKEWKSIMGLFGVNDSVTCSFDFSNTPMRQYKKIQYQCQCRTHSLTKIRHNRVLRGYRYHCRHCQTELAEVKQ